MIICVIMVVVRLNGNADGTLLVTLTKLVYARLS